MRRGLRYLVDVVTECMAFREQYLREVLHLTGR